MKKAEHAEQKRYNTTGLPHIAHDNYPSHNDRGPEGRPVSAYWAQSNHRALRISIEKTNTFIESFFSHDKPVAKLAVRHDRPHHVRQ